MEYCYYQNRERSAAGNKENAAFLVEAGSGSSSSSCSLWHDRPRRFRFPKAMSHPPAQNKAVSKTSKPITEPFDGGSTAIITTVCIDSRTEFSRDISSPALGTYQSTLLHVLPAF